MTWKRSDGPHRPGTRTVLFSVLVELTYRCNLDCFFCYNDLGLRGEPLRAEQYVALLRGPGEMEVLNLTLSGGEPLAHPDFLRLGARARELGFVVRVKSNGHALRGELARRLRDEVDPFLIEVSLHGATAATHDRQTRVPGSFDRLLATCARCGRSGLRVKINSTLTAWNEGEIEAMFALADSLGLPLQFDPEVTPRDDGDREPLAVAPSAAKGCCAPVPPAVRARAGAGGAGSRAEPWRAAATTAPCPRRVDKHCGAGSAGIAVDPYGNVYPCVQWRRPVGNLHQQVDPRDLDRLGRARRGSRADRRRQGAWSTRMARRAAAQLLPRLGGHPHRRPAPDLPRRAPARDAHPRGPGRAKAGHPAECLPS